MARDARKRKVPEPEPSALAHRALRARLASADGVAALRSLVGEIKAFFPAAADDRAAGRTDLGRWEALYAEDPAAAYRSAPADLRKAIRSSPLGRRPAAADWRPSRSRTWPSAVARADRAAEQLPERRDLPARLLEKAIGAARRELGTLRQDEVRRLAEVYRVHLRRPDDARQVAPRLAGRSSGPGSARPTPKGGVALADLYDDLIQDRVTAVELLRKAWKIDPSSRETAEAFRSRGFRREKDHWVEADAPSPAGPAGDQPIRLARPSRRARASSASPRTRSSRN